MIANAIKQAYSSTAPTHLGVGIETPCTSAIWRSLEASFFRPKFNGGLCRGSSERRSRAGSFNSVQSATLLIETNGGSSLNLHEDTIMDDVRHARKLFSQLEPESQFVCLSILRNPQLLIILDSLPRDHVAVISEHMRSLVFGEVCH